MKKASRGTGPSRMSLREMPEVDLKDGRWRPNPYAARITPEGITCRNAAGGGRGDWPFGHPLRSFPSSGLGVCRICRKGEGSDHSRRAPRRDLGMDRARRHESLRGRSRHARLAADGRSHGAT
jgi:hypothetical protein